MHKARDLGTPQLMRQTENNLDCLTAENESQNNATSSIAVPLEEDNRPTVAGAPPTPTGKCVNNFVFGDRGTWESVTLWGEYDCTYRECCVWIVDCHLS